MAPCLFSNFCLHTEKFMQDLKYYHTFTKQTMYIFKLMRGSCDLAK